MTFADLGLSDELLRAVNESGYDEPTPIQRQAIPSVLMMRDIIGIAQTGTGKTAGFVLPMIDILAQGRARARMPRSLILEPTRELAAQVAENFEKYGKYHKLSMALLIGGVQMGDQVKALEKGVDVLIATPGRLMDLFGRGKILLTGCNLLVIDEADRMLDMGFIPDIEEICTKLPKNRQTLLFSATMPGPIKKLADRFLSNPKTIEVSRPASSNLLIDQRMARVDSRRKREALTGLLRAEQVRSALIFCNRKTTVRDLATSLKREGFNVGQIQGDMDQSDRIKELDRFKNDEINILVASDVAARGLDIKGVSHVFNYDVPWHPDDYVHRIGRTGRAGKTGIAITLVTSADAEAIENIQKLTSTRIPEMGAKAAPAAAAATPKDEAGDAVDDGAEPAAREARKPRESREPREARQRAPARRAPPASRARPASPAPKRRPRRSRKSASRAPKPAAAAPAPAPWRRWLPALDHRGATLAAGAAALVVIAAVLAIVSGGDDKPDAAGSGDMPRALKPSTVDAPQSGILTRPNSLTIADGKVWAMSFSDGAIALVDANTGVNAGRLKVGHGGSSLAAGFTSVWVTKESTPTVRRINAKTLRTVPGGTVEIAQPGRNVAVATGAGAVWVAVRNPTEESMSRHHRERALQLIATALLLAPLGYFFLLRQRPNLDQVYEIPVQHFYLVSLTSLTALTLAIIVGIAAIRSRAPRTFFVTLGFLAFAGIFSVHGLMSPGENMILMSHTTASPSAPV